MGARDGPAEGTTFREGDGTTEPDGVSSSGATLRANSATCSATCEECTTGISSHTGMSSMQTVTINFRTGINCLQTDVNSMRTVAHLGIGAVEPLPLILAILALGFLGSLGLRGLDLHIFFG